MLYYYFGNKEALFLAVLEASYAQIRSAERALDLEQLAPRAAHMTALVLGYLRRQGARTAKRRIAP